MVAGVTITDRLTTGILITALITIASCGGGGGGPDPKPQPTRFTLSGTVRNASGNPVNNAQILLGFTTTTTDAAGSFAYNNLQAGSYTISIQDGSGNFDCREVALSATSTDFSFTLPTSGGGFRVTSVSPSLNSTGVALDSPITIEATMEPSLAGLDGIQFTPDPGTVEITWDDPNIVITPRFQLPLDQTIVIELPKTLKSSGGQTIAHPVRWSFRTSPADDSPPRLLSTNPSDGNSSYPPNLGVSFEFNENVSTQALSFSALSDPPLELTSRAIGNILAVSAVNGWGILTEYTVTIAGITDTSGNLQSETYSVTFTTSEEPAHSDDIQADWNEQLDMIVFASSQNGGYDIFSISPDGSSLSQLTSLPGDEYYPSVSADGTLLTFQHRESGGRWGVWVQELEGGVAQRISPEDYNDTQPTFTNTMTNDIVFVSDRVSPSGLFTMHFDGSNPVELDSEFNSTQTQPDLHPLLDTQILFVSGRAGTQDIWRKTVSAIDGSAININLTSDTFTNEFAPSWNPDAGSFVFISDDGGTNSLWIADAAGEFRRKVTTFDIDLDFPEMSPFPGSQECIASLYNGPNGASLVMIDLVSGEILRHLTGPEAAN